MSSLVRVAVVFVALLGLGSCRGGGLERELGFQDGQWLGPCLEGRTCAEKGAACMRSSAANRRGMACVGGYLCTVPCYENRDCVLKTGVEDAICLVRDRVCAPAEVNGCRIPEAERTKEKPPTGQPEPFVER